MKTFYPFFALAFVVILTSCSNLHIEKRHYRNGFYIHLNSDCESREVANQELQPAPETAEPSGQTDSIIAPEEINNAGSSSEAPEKVRNAASNDPATSATQEKSSESDRHEQASDPQQIAQKSEAPPAGGDTMLIIQVILAIFIPPLAVYLKEGITSRFWLVLILSILGGGFFFYPVFGGLWLVAVILALLIVLDVM